MINNSTIYVESGYSNMITGIMLYRQGITVPFPFGTDWSEIGVGAGIRMENLQSGYGSCGIEHDRMFWFGIQQYEASSFTTVGINSSVYALSGQSINVISPSAPFCMHQPQAITTGDKLIGYGMSPTGLYASGSSNWQFCNSAPFFPATSEDSVNYPLTSGDYRYVIIRYIKNVGQQSVMVSNDKRNYEPGTGVNFTVKSPNIHTLEFAMDNLYNYPYTGFSGALVGGLDIANAFFIYSPVSGLKVSPIFIKRYA